MVTEVLDGVEAELDQFVAGVADRVLARIEAADGELSPVLKAALRRGVRAAVRDALARLRSRAELPSELPPGLIELVRLQAAARYDPRGFADAWLVGQELFWNRFALVAEQTLSDPALCWEVTKAARLRLSGHAAALSKLFRTAWEAELERGAGIHDEARLQAAVSRALDGHWVDAEELGYDLTLHHVAVVADAPAAVEALAREAERESLVVTAPGRGTWGWLGGRSRIPDSDLDALVEWQRSQGGEVAFGEPAVGVSGFAESHQQALEAREIAAATRQRVARFADLRLLAAVLRDGDLAKGFVERELGELDRPSERTRELRATLRAYLEHGQSIATTAALRRRDRKTIVRQLRAAERLIDHTVSDRSDELLIALRIADILRRRG